MFIKTKKNREYKTQKLINFHAFQTNFDYKIIEESGYNLMLVDYHLQYLMSDFGIYSNKYLYKGQINKLNEIVGTYSKDRDEITRFIDFFDTCWNSPIASIYDFSKKVNKITLEELFE